MSGIILAEEYEGAKYPFFSYCILRSRFDGALNQLFFLRRKMIDCFCLPLLFRQICRVAYLEGGNLFAAFVTLAKKV